jgi:hypothetical protein
MGFKQITFASILVHASALGWGATVANAQAPITDYPPEVGAASPFTEASAEIDPQREQAFQLKQRRKLIVGWTLMGTGTALALSAVWLSRSGDDASVGLKRSLAVVIPGVAMVVAGGGLLINRRVKKTEHDREIQVRVGLMSISVQGRF